MPTLSPLVLTLNKDDQQENISKSARALKMEQQDADLRIGTEERSIDKKVK